jgi:methylase of polypeptide subunit release factors
MDDLARGESGRARLAHDRYAEPLENIAALVIGLHKAKIVLPSVVLDPCAGSGGLCRGLMALEPACRVFGSDLYPDRAGADVYGSKIPLDATNAAHLEMALRVIGATGIVSNPPYSK